MTERRLFADLAKMATGAVGTLAGARGELEELIRLRMERVLARMDLVSRDEFEAVKQMAIAARKEVEELRLQLAQTDTPAKPAKPRKPAA